MTKTETTLDFAVIFDNGGGITLQSDGYVHYYDDPAQAATDVTAILADNSTDDWEGHDPESRIDYNYEDVRNGGYRWMDRTDVESAIASPEVTDSGYAFREFFAALVPARDRLDAMSRDNVFDDAVYAAGRMQEMGYSDEQIVNGCESLIADDDWSQDREPYTWCALVAREISEDA